MNTFVNPMTDDWALTDGDNKQWGKRISLSKYHFYNNDSVEFCRETPCIIDLDSYPILDIESTINSYDYSLLPFNSNYILNLHSRDEACWIIAEALYEFYHEMFRETKK